ncbi:MAG TPA: CBS domain-containing protein [Nitrospiria bacterium]|nr:CBS domain-containing protein [Nitrospiria bacterium]
MQLRDIMKRDVISVFPDSTITEAARMMEEHNIGCVLVVKDGQAKGILTDRDIVLKVIARGSDPTLTKTADVMQPHVISASPDTDILDASRLMTLHHVRRLPIQEAGQLLGIVSVMDLARVIQEEVDNLFSLRATPVYR